jgi:hypothetical protein
MAGTTRHACLVAAIVLLASGTHAAVAQDGPVTTRDLIGLTITADIRIDRSVRVQGQLFPNVAQSVITLRVRSESEIDARAINTVRNGAGRVIHSDNRGGVSALDEIYNNPDGKSGLFFEDGKFVQVRSFEQGAFRMIYNFQRKGGVLTCSVDAGYARGDGGRGKIIVRGSAGRAEIVSARVSSAKCEIRRS